MGKKYDSFSERMLVGDVLLCLPYTSLVARLIILRGWRDCHLPSPSAQDEWVQHACPCQRRTPGVWYSLEKEICIGEPNGESLSLGSPSEETSTMLGFPPGALPFHWLGSKENWPINPRVNSLLCLLGLSGHQITVFKQEKGSIIFNCGTQPSRTTNSRKITSVLSM